jgi:hypothetical protein
MALPPEPVAELIAKAEFIFIGEVTQVLGLGPKPPPPEGAKRLPKTATSVGWVSAWQKLKVRVDRALKGEPPGELVVDKPVAPYLLKVGSTGTFMIGADGKILGRYGPDSHPGQVILKALGLG